MFQLNDSLSTDEPLDPDSSLVSPIWKLRDIFVLALYGLTTIVALFGNSLVCKVVINSRRMRTTVNLLIVNMAISDILCALTIPAQWILCTEHLLDTFSNLYIACAMSKTIQVLSFYLSSLTFCAIAIDRYIVIHNPMKTRSPRFFITIVWIISLAFVTLTAVSVKIFTYSFDSDLIIRCRVVLKFDYPFSSDSIRHIRVAGVLLTQYTLPVIISVSVYAKIVHTIWNRNVGDMIDVQRNNLEVIKKRTIKMLIIISLVFAICWFPVNVMHFIDFYIKPLSSGGCNSTTLYLMFYWLGISSCSYNPFVFWWLNEEFRAGARSVWHFITCEFMRTKERSISTSSSNSFINRTHVFHINEEFNC